MNKLMTILFALFMSVGVMVTSANAQLSVSGPGGSSDFTLGTAAEDTTILDVATSRVDTLHVTLRNLTYVLAGIGLIALVIMAAIGKFQFKWLFALAGGLFLLASFQAMINFLN